jgi:hypothetical protein
VVTSGGNTIETLRRDGTLKSVYTGSGASFMKTALRRDGSVKRVQISDAPSTRTAADGRAITTPEVSRRLSVGRDNRVKHELKLVEHGDGSRVFVIKRPSKRTITIGASPKPH